MTEASKSALITGGAGFIGSHLAELLLPTAGRSSSSTTCRPARCANVAHLRDATGFHLVVDTVLSAARS